MNVEAVLEEAGLNEGERKVYLSLLKKGKSTVNNIKTDTQLHRTTIYDFLEKLLNKGLVNYIVEEGTKHYRATNPEKLLDYVKEKEENVQSILPKLKELSKTQEESISVEIHKGIEGCKTLLRDLIREKKDYVVFGTEEEKFLTEMPPHILEQHFKREQKAGITSRVLTMQDAPFIFKEKNIQYRYIPKKYFGLSTTIIYGNKVWIMTWNPLNNILINNKELANGYKKQFELLWKHAKEKN